MFLNKNLEYPILESLDIISLEYELDRVKMYNESMIHLDVFNKDKLLSNEQFILTEVKFNMKWWDIVKKWFVDFYKWVKNSLISRYKRIKKAISNRKMREKLDVKNKSFKDHSLDLDKIQDLKKDYMKAKVKEDLQWDDMLKNFEELLNIVDDGVLDKKFNEIKKRMDAGNPQIGDSVLLSEIKKRKLLIKNAASSVAKKLELHMFKDLKEFNKFMENPDTEINI